MLVINTKMELVPREILTTIVPSGVKMDNVKFVISSKSILTKFLTDRTNTD